MKFPLAMTAALTAARLIGQPATISSDQFPQHGLKLGITAVYLAKPPEVPAPEATDFATLAVGQDLRSQAESRSDCDGALAQAAADAATKRLLKEIPCAAFETWAEQRSSDYEESIQAGFSGVERTPGRTVLRRFVRDTIRQIYISYAVTVETLADGSYRISFGPSSDPPPAALRGKTDWMLISPAQYPVPQIVRDGDAVRLELYSNGVRKLVDYVHAGRRDRMAMREEAAHDSYAADAELTFTRPRLRVNGAARDEAIVVPETLRGPLLWVYIPGYGRYVLSLQPHAGFEEAGEAAGGSLTFTADGNIFRIDAAERIAAGSGAYTVHMSPDLGWMPADPLDRGRVMIGSSPGAIGPEL